MPIPPPPSEDGFRLDPAFFPRRLDIDIDPVLYDQLEVLSQRSGRSIAEIVQELISGSFSEPADPTVIDA